MQGKENEKMEGLTIGTFPKLRAVLPGESTFVESTFENRGSAPIELPSNAGHSPLAYDLLSDKDRVVRYQVSQAARDERRNKDLAPPREFPPQTLQPGRSVQRQEDLVDLAGEDFAPGKYLIRTRYPEEGTPEVVSALSPFTVLVPKIESFSSSGAGLQGKLVTAYAHRRDDGGVLLLQRESFSTPAEGVAFRRIQLGPGPAVQVAIAVDAVEAGNGRWFGWLRDGSFEAASGWGNRVVTRLQPTRIGASDTVLLSPGFQVDVGVGMFGFILNVNGTTHLKAVRTTGTGTTVVFDTELTPHGISNVRWNYRPDSGFALFWQGADGRVSRRLIDPNGKPLGEAVVTSSVPPSAWDVAPLGNPELVSTVHAPDGRTFFRNLGSGSREDASRVAPAELAKLPEGMPPNPAFTFCTTEAGIKVIAAGGGKIWSTSISPSGGGVWLHVADAAQPAYLHAFAPRGRTCWAEWLELGVGLRRAKLP